MIGRTTLSMHPTLDHFDDSRKENLPALGLIYAQAANGVIGKDNSLPWHLQEDLAHFKAVTLGAPVLMGRRTWESLPERFRPLPGRRNLILTRDPQWGARGALSVQSIEEALVQCQGVQRLWVIGGAQVYRAALPMADLIEVTEIHQEFQGDSVAPVLGADWQQVHSERHVGRNGLEFSFIRLERAVR